MSFGQLNPRRFFVVSGLSLLTLACLAPASAQLNVFVDFTSDLHDGSGGGANGQADWIDELNQATFAAGVTNFSAAERSIIQNNIVSQLGSMYSEYNINFTTTNPGGVFDTIYFGVEAGAGVLGFAPLDIGNLFAEQVSNVAPENFDFFIESFESRATQISEISLGLAGTAAHELGHSFGLHHHFAYSHNGITPANFNNTGGLQNGHIIATGSTGLDELGRETVREFSPFSKVMLDISGGARNVFIGQDNISVVTGGIISDPTEDLGSDAGATIGTAQALSFSTGTTSNRDIAFVEADLDGSATDVDTYSFFAGRRGSLLAHVFSTDLVYGPGGEFNAMLELLDSSGTVLASNDDVHFDGDTYDSGTLRDEDPFLLNVTLPGAGFYYLRITPVSDAEIGSNYWLVAAMTTVPEPGTTGIMLLAFIGFCLSRSRSGRDW